ncbi:MAG TPA: hypothetical protein ENJ08_12865 [Gammaproteobacteria bacterium]|nr:hypothetical protein [Gammaproteobacteria bacterium]
MRIKKIVHLIMAIVVVCFLFFSGGDENKKINLMTVLKKSFSDIYVSRFSKDYPFTNNILYYCIKNNYAPCLRLYHQVKDAKNTIISYASDESLEITLDIIESECLVKNDPQSSMNCYGGIMSLYFYNSLENDKYILSRFEKYPGEINFLIFDFNFLWYYNRSDSDLWIRYVENADINWEYDGRVKNLIEMFNKDISEVRGEPWVFM